MTIKSIIPVLSAIFFSANLISGQDSVRIVIEEIYTISQIGFIEKCEIRIPVPQDYIKHQAIKNIAYSIKPDYTIKEGNSRYAIYELSETELGRISSIEIILELELYDYDLSVARKNSTESKLRKNQRRWYLRKTGYYKLPEESLDTILNIQLTDEVEKVNQIHDFVVDHLEYQTFFGKDKGAQYALKERWGDCTEYADLMIALCRYSDIPARRVSGYTVMQDTSQLLAKIFRSSGHAWVEVYFNDFGWIPFDPTHSDGSSTINFNNLTTKYIYVNFAEFEKGMSWRWWGNGSIQVKLDRKIRDIHYPKFIHQ